MWYPINHSPHQTNPPNLHDLVGSFRLLSVKYWAFMVTFVLGSFNKLMIMKLLVK